MIATIVRLENELCRSIDINKLAFININII